MESIEKIEETLTKEPFFGGNLPSEADKTNFEAMKEIPDIKFPNARAWYTLVKLFTPEVRMKWGKKEEKKEKKEKKHEKKSEKKEEETKPAEKPAEKKDETAEDDIFGGGEDLEAAKKVMDEKKKADAEAAKKKEKKKEVAKSYIRFEVKAFDNTTDLDKLAVRIRKDVVMDGLVWEKEHKKEPFAFGVEKLLMSCIIEDDKIVTDDLMDAITAFDDGELVQSVDIQLFNKL